MSDLIKRSIHSAVWVTLNSLTLRLIQLVSLIVLARIIEPTEYGIATTILMLIGVVETLTEPGLERAFIQSKDSEKAMMDTIWIFNIGRGLVTYFFIYLAAPFLAHFFQIDGSVGLIRIAGLYVIIWSFRSIGLSSLFKNLDFKKYYFFDLSRQIIFLLTAWAWAVYQKPTALALIMGHLALYATSVVVIYCLDSYRPRFSFDFRKLKKLIGYGKWVTGQNMINYINGILDSSVIAHLIGPTGVAYYSKARDIAGLPGSFTNQVVSKVAFPVYAKIQDSMAAIREGYLKTYEFTLFTSIPFIVIIWLFNAKIVNLLLGDQWLLAAPILKIIIFYITIKNFINMTATLFDGIGHPRLRFHTLLIQLVTTAIGCYLLIPPYGPIGAAYAGLISSLPTGLYAFIKTQSLIKMPLKIYAPSLIIVGSASAILAGGLVLTRNIIETGGAWQFVLAMSLAGLVYLILTYSIGKYFSSGPYHLIKMIIRNIV